MTFLGILDASGLSMADRDALEELLGVYGSTRGRNFRLERYYEGDVMVRDVGINILPSNADIHVDLSCDWAKKAVKALS